MEYLSFWTTGEFITNTARDWFWAENKTYPKVEEFLLCCMSGTDLPKSTLLAFIRDILLGRRKFIGNTKDGSYSMVDDDSDIRKQYSNIRLFISIEDVERYLDANIRNRAYAEKREAVREFQQDDYGWVDPKGKFYGVPWGNHQEWAWEYLGKHFSHKSINAFFDTHPNTTWDRAGDFLQSRGWVLLHNTQRLEAHMTQNETKPLTKAQKEFLYDYFMLRNRDKDAIALFQCD